MTNAQLLPAILVPLIGWRFYRRIRRNVGRQLFRRSRHLTSIILFALLLLLVGATSALHPSLLLGLGAGVLGGLVLAVIGLRLTRFEHGTEPAYTPNPSIGIAVSLLFVGRLVYRFTLLASVTDFSHPPESLGQSALTLLTFGLTAGYYLCNSAGLLWHFRAAAPARP